MNLRVTVVLKKEDPAIFEGIAELKITDNGDLLLLKEKPDAKQRHVDHKYFTAYAFASFVWHSVKADIM